MAAQLTVTQIGPVETRPLSLPANDPVVTSTMAILGWQPAPNVGGVPQMSLVLSEMLAAFSIRCKISRNPADVLAAAPINILTLNLQPAAWGRILLCIRNAGLGLALPKTLAMLHEFIRAIVVPAGAPDPFLLSAPDWAPLPAWAAGPPALRPALARVRFLSLAPVLLLEVTSGPLALSAAWANVARLAGAIGPASSQAARAVETSQIQVTAASIRRHSTGGGDDGSLALGLRSTLQRTSLPKQLQAHKASPEEQGEEMADAFAYKLSEADRLAVEQKRFDLIEPW